LILYKIKLLVILMLHHIIAVKGRTGVYSTCKLIPRLMFNSEASEVQKVNKTRTLI